MKMQCYRFKFPFYKIFFIFISIILFTYIDIVIEYGILLSSQGGQNINPGGQNSFLNLVLNPITDTDRLADFLEERKNMGYSNISQAGIKLSHPRRTIFTPYNEAQSRIARYVNINHDNIFYRGSPQNTTIDDSLLSKIRDLHENVPTDFV